MFLQLNCLAFGCLQQTWMSDMVHAPLPLNDHSAFMLCLSEAGYLHHIQACVQVALSMPQITAKNFKSLHENIL